MFVDRAMGVAWKSTPQYSPEILLFKQETLGMSTTIEQPVSGQDGDKKFPTNGSEPPMSECLTSILQCLKTMNDGDFSVRLPVSWSGLPGKIADNFNDIVTANEQMAFELKRVGQAVGKEGKTRERIHVIPCAPTMFDTDALAGLAFF